MPRAGAPARAEQRATLSRLAHELFCADAIGELLEHAEPRDELERDIVRVSRRDYDRARRVPGELVAELSRGAAEGHGAWSEARAGAGFAHFAPALERNLDLARQLSACFDAGEHVYDALRRGLRAGHAHRAGACRPRRAARRARAARRGRGRGRRPRAARGPVGRGRPARAGRHRAAGGRRRRGLVAPGRRRAPVPGDDGHHRRAAHDALRPGRRRGAVRRAARVRPRALRASDRPCARAHAAAPPAPRAPGTSRRAGCGRTWSAARRRSGAGACRTRPPRCPSASATSAGRRCRAPPPRCARR